MRSPLTPLPVGQKSSNWKNERGFSLLEVVVALAILAGGFLAVINLYSGSILSVDFSGQYLKAVTLANSKINELEMLNFRPGEQSGNFKNEESYRWEVDISPHDSPLNDADAGIQLQKILLKVLWEDQGKTRNVELATLHLEGQTYPVSDSSLEKLFAGGSSPASSGGEDGASDDSQDSDSTDSSGDSSGSDDSGGSSGSNVSGASGSVISCPSGQTYFLGAGCI